MGLIDAIKKPIQQQFIARPDDSKDKIVYKWPETNIRMLTRLTVQPDEVALFVKEGEVIGTVEPGTHRIDGKNLPFLGGLVDSFTADNALLAEVYFVSTREFTDLPFGGFLDNLEDKDTELVVELRMFGEYSMTAVDPKELILKMVGTQDLDENSGITNWVKSQIMKRARAIIANKVSDGEWDIVGISRYSKDLEEVLLEEMTEELDEYGVKLEKFGNIQISLKEEDADTLKKLKRDKAYASSDGAADAALKVGIGKGMEKGNGGGESGVGLGVGIGIGSKLIGDDSDGSDKSDNK